MGIENVEGSTNRVTTEWKGDTPWKRGEHNPDHRMAVIHAANEDFQSLCTASIGSYLIYCFTESVRRDMSSWNIGRGPRYLGEMMNEIQNLLEDKGRQLVVPLYTNETERIVFGKGRIPSDADRRDRASFNVEMKQQDDKHPMIEVSVQQTIVEKKKEEEAQEEAVSLTTNNITSELHDLDQSTSNIEMRRLDSPQAIIDESLSDPNAEEKEVTMDDVTNVASIATNPLAAESHDVDQNERNKMNQGIAGKVLKYEVLGLLEQESIVNDPEYQQMNIDYIKRRKKKM